MGLMTARITHEEFYLELTGSNATVWDGPGAAAYTGPIDGIEVKFPDLWKHLIDNSFIKLA